MVLVGLMVVVIVMVAMVTMLSLVFAVLLCHSWLPPWGNSQQGASHGQQGRQGHTCMHAPKDEGPCI